MKKSVIIIALVALVAVVVGTAIYLSLSRTNNTATGATDTTSGTETNHDATPSDTSTQNTSGATDLTSKTSVDVSIRDLSFSPATIKIKKGTKVTWTNNDTVGHNVVASTPSSSGGLPTSHALFNKGETFSHTFETAGTFPYICTPHPFMKGSVEVIE